MQAKIRDKQTKERYYFHYFYILVYTQVGSYILVIEWVVDSIMHIFHKETKVASLCLKITEKVSFNNASVASYV